MVLSPKKKAELKTCIVHMGDVFFLGARLIFIIFKLESVLFRPTTHPSGLITTKKALGHNPIKPILL